MKCSKCHYQMLATDAICPRCGTPVLGVPHHVRDAIEQMRRFEPPAGVREAMEQMKTLQSPPGLREVMEQIKTLRSPPGLREAMEQVKRFQPPPGLREAMEQMSLQPSSVLREVMQQMARLEPPRSIHEAVQQMKSFDPPRHLEEQLATFLDQQRALTAQTATFIRSLSEYLSDPLIQSVAVDNSGSILVGDNAITAEAIMEAVGTFEAAPGAGAEFLESFLQWLGGLGRAVRAVLIYVLFPYFLSITCKLNHTYL